MLIDHKNRLPTVPIDLGKLQVIQYLKRLKKDRVYDVFVRYNNIVTIKPSIRRVNEYRALLMQLFYSNDCNFTITYKRKDYNLLINNGILYWKISDNIYHPLIAVVGTKKAFIKAKLQGYNTLTEDFITLLDYKIEEPQFKKLLRKLKEDYEKIGRLTVDIEDTLFEKEVQSFKSIKEYKEKEKEDLNTLKNYVQRLDTEDISRNLI